MKLIGLDFETANWKNGSICSVGLALVEDGNVVDTRSWLVRPHRSMNWVSPRFTEIHGITSFHLRDAPEFEEVWPMMSEFIQQGDCVVIHNAPFDLKHLGAALMLYALPGTQFPYLCSLRVSRKALPHLHCHKLDAVANHLGYTFKHHDALEDAITCARIVAQVGIPEGLRSSFQSPLS